jgi:predicted RNase H-like HicB family nuclease
MNTLALNYKTEINEPVIFIENQDTGRVTAILKGINGAVSQGNSKEEAISNLIECLKVMVDCYINGLRSNLQATIADQPPNKQIFYSRVIF